MLPKYSAVYMLEVKVPVDPSRVLATVFPITLLWMNTFADAK